MAIRKRTASVTVGADDKKLIREFRKWLNLHDVTLEAARVESAQKKLANKLFIELIKTGGIGEADFVRILDEEYYYDNSLSEKISAEAWYEMWKTKEITKDQYFAALSVGKTEAKKAIGEDQVIEMTTVVRSKEKDIRKRKSLKTGTATPVLHTGKVEATPAEAPKLKHKRKRVRVRT